jgi:hypothetical protein
LERYGLRVVDVGFTNQSAQPKVVNIGDHGLGYSVMILHQPQPVQGPEPCADIITDMKITVLGSWF